MMLVVVVVVAVVADDDACGCGCRRCCVDERGQQFKLQETVLRSLVFVVTVTALVLTVMLD